MRKIPPSERISNEISELLEKGSVETEDFLSMLLRKSVKKIIQETLEQEISDYLGRDYFERNPEAKTGYRNGYEPKTIKTAEGKVMIDVPQLRDTEESYRSSFLKAYLKHVERKSAKDEVQEYELYLIMFGRFFIAHIQEKKLARAR